MFELFFSPVIWDPRYLSWSSFVKRIFCRQILDACNVEILRKNWIPMFQ